MEQSYRPSKDTKDAIVVWTGTTTSAGLPGGTTLVDTSLTQGNTYWDNMGVLILSGNSDGQIRTITGFVTGTITVSPAFASQIASGTKYNIIAAVQPTTGGGSATLANQNLILGDIGDASASTLLSLYGILGNPSASLSTTILDGIDARANNPTLNALLGVTDAAGRSINGNIGDFQARTNLQTLLASLGIPDTAAKPLYTCLITDRLDNATYGLSAIETLVDDLEGSVGAIEGATTLHNKLTAARAGYLDFLPPLYYGLVSASNQATGGGASTITLAVGASAVNDFYKGQIVTVYAGAGAGQARAIVSYDGGTKVATISPSWATQPDATSFYIIIAAGSTVIAPTSVGNSQISTTTIDLNQAAGTYTLFTGTTQTVLVEKLTITMPNSAAGGALTSISIQTDNTTPRIFINSSQGAVANLTAEAEISKDAPITIATGKKIQLTITGGAHGVAYSCTVTVLYRAIVAGGTLA